MIHPLVFGLGLLDVLGLGLLLAAALRAGPVLRAWRPGSASARQLELERNMEAASLFARGGALVLLLSTATLVLAVASVLPTLVPGAMCGTGVIEATDGLGSRALTMRALALLLLAVWFVLDGLDRNAPQAPLAPLVALAVVVATPMSLWAAIDTARALWSLDTHGAVDCCAAVYAEAGGGARSLTDPAGEGALIAFGVGAVALIGGGLGLGLRRGRGMAPALVMASLALLWGPLAGLVLVQRFAAYHYEVLAHHCPWCLFLSEHGAVGYVLFGALAVVMLEGVAIGAAVFGTSTAPEVASAARARIRAASFRVAVAAAVFVVTAVGPALAWWWRFGVWMTA